MKSRIQVSEVRLTPTLGEVTESGVRLVLGINKNVLVIVTKVIVTSRRQTT